jgi:hypothetical protein
MIKTEKTFGAATEALRNAGYPAGDLLPLIPPDARLDERAGVEPKILGKIPGRFIAGGDRATGEGTWTGLRSWADGLPAKDQNAVLSWPTRNVGLRAHNFPGLDVDTNSEEARDVVRGVAEAALHLGGPIRTRAGAPPHPYSLQA